MYGSGQFEEMLVAIFTSQKTAESARDTLKTVITKQPLLERENLIMTPFHLFLYGRKARPRNESRLIRVKPAKSLQNAQKKKGNKELKTKTEIETAKDSKLNCNTPSASPSASSREISERTQVETVTNKSLSKLKEINQKLKQELQETCNALDAKTQKMKALGSELNETKEQLGRLTTRCQDYEMKSFLFNQLKQSDKLINFYTGFLTVGVFNALFDYCDPGKDGENIRYWHSSSTSQDTTVLDESSPKSW